MKLLGILVIIAASLGTATLEGGLNDIAKINSLKVQAERAYEQEDYQAAAKYYTTLVDSLQVNDELVRLNLAHALIRAGDTATAQRNYTTLANSPNPSLKSVAYQQLGVINTHQTKYKEALATFKESLKADPTNEDARYDYELVKKLMAEQQQQEENQEGEDEKQEQNEEKGDQEQQKNQEGEGEQSEEQQQSEEQKSEQQQGEGEQSEEQSEQDAEQSESEEGQEGEEAPPSVADKLKEMNITEEKARMILEAMRNNEMQYIQQNRRKPQQPRDRTKPDW